MALETTITDPFLQSVLDATQKAQSQCLKLLEDASARNADIKDGEVSDSHADLEYIRQRKLLDSHMAHLRGLNRTAVHKVRETKQDTAEGRAGVDTLHLQLQNLYYEQQHLHSEIAACEGYEFRSLPLITMEDFLGLKPEFQDVDEGTLMEARINHEYAEREALESQRQELLRKKQSLIAENKKRKDDLASLDQDLEKFIDAAKPIQKIFEKEY